jgi:peptidoglycan/LPS O-acetylase OafA/YrhL
MPDMPAGGETPPARGRGERSDLLDAVRGVAVCMILATHLWVPLPTDTVLWHIGPVVDRLMGLSWTGVDLFFILSGYLICGSLLDNRGSGSYFSVFYGRRTFRILPLYAIMLGLAAATGSLVYPLAHLTFTQNFAFSWARHWGPDSTGVTWSLAIEEQFYLILPFLVRFSAPRRLPYLFLAAIAVAPITRLSIMAWADNYYAAYLLMPCRMEGLFMGALLAWAIRDLDARAWLRAHRHWLDGALIALGLGYIFLLFYSPGLKTAPMWSVGYTWCACFYAVILTRLLLRPNWVAVSRFWRVVCWFGVRAYALYLFHVPLARVLDSWGLPVHGLANALLASIGIVAIAAVSWWMVEKPLLAFARHRFRYQPSRLTT